MGQVPFCLSPYRHPCDLFRLRHDELRDALDIIPDTEPEGVTVP